jgi:hypothetical protein
VISRKDHEIVKNGRLVGLLAVIVLVVSANADTLRLRSGRVLHETFLGAAQPISTSGFQQKGSK